MEITGESIPTSWTDGGLDWNNPNPGDFRYFLAIQEAIKERCFAVGYGGIFIQSRLYSNQYKKFACLNTGYLNNLGSIIDELSCYFLNVESSDWKPVIDVFPNTMHIIQPTGIPPGSLISSASTWLIEAKQKLDQMRYVDLKNELHKFYKQGQGGTLSLHLANTPAETHYLITINQIDASWSSEWGEVFNDMEYLSAWSEYEEYYTSESTFQNRIPYWVNGYSHTEKYCINLIYSSSARPNIKVYARAIMPSWIRDANFFHPEEFFPNDQIEMNKICELTNFKMDGDVIDFDPAFNHRPEFPSRNSIIFPSTLPDDKQLFNIMQGAQFDKFHIVGDFFSENGFKFKPE